jgi:hypothetical protein
MSRPARSSQAMNAIEACFQPLYGRPCWDAKSGFGSFMTMEFGEPHLEIREPRVAVFSKSKRAQQLLARRLVTVRGEWHLWIYCCEWHVYTGHKLVGDSALESSSKRRIVRAARELDGQKLVSVTVDPSCGGSTFRFDLGSRLETRPYEDSEQWMLFEPSGEVLTYRADGCYSHHPGDTPRDEVRWMTLSQGEPNETTAAELDGPGASP